MNGSVWEWVSDCWHSSYKGAPNDGSSWETAGCQQEYCEAVRGETTLASCVHPSEFYYDADIRYIANGFRVALSLE